MGNNTFNPCRNCDTGFACCALKGACGLMLTKEEFDRHFKGHTDKIVVRSSRNFIVISSKEGLTCPHLNVKGCKIYHDRPIDCRLFPYTMSNVFEMEKYIKIIFHDRSDCPHKSHLFQPTDEARALAMEFARSVFGPSRSIIVIFEKNRTIFSRARNFIDRKLSERYTNSVA
jgi:Fe-S-cluster containining protein